MTYRRKTSDIYKVAFARGSVGKRLPDLIPPETPLRELGRRYTVHLLALNRSPKTVEVAQKWLREFSDFMEDKNWVSADEFRTWLLALQSRPRRRRTKTGEIEGGNLSPATIHQAYRAVKAFLNWLRREGYLEEIPTDRVEAPQTSDVFPDIPSSEAVSKLLKSINRRRPSGIRDYAMILLLIDTGLRAGEIVKLKLEDLDLKAGLLRVFGKGRKHRMVPMGEKARRALWYWLRARPEDSLDDSLFVYRNGIGITQRALYLMLARKSREAGLGRINPHSLRHFFATRFLANGGDMYTLQRILGHTTPTMVARYLHMTGEDIAALHRRASPGDMLG